jgi:tetratricopeptide (TPR) repeat protein
MSMKTERLLSRAKKLINKGGIEEARGIYLSILKNYPKNIEANKGLTFLEKDLKTKPTQTQLDSIVNLYTKGDFKEALTILKPLINEYPNNALLYNVSGACLNEISETESAIINFKKAITIDSDYSEAYYNLGVVYQKISQNNQALECYQKAISFQHAYPAAHNNSGIIYLENEEISSAIKSFEWATAYSPNYSQAYNNLGSALQRINQFEKAKTEFEKAVSLDSNYAQAYENLGIVSEIINLPNESINSFENALRINPHLTNCYRNLSKLKTFKEKDPQIAQMQSLHSKSDLKILDKINLSFALAKVYEDLNDQDNFFKFLNEGNELRKQALNYQIDQSQNFHSAILNLFKSPQPVINTSIDKLSNIRPIFIVGMPRSGTSLVEQIISSHHEVYGAGELLTLRKIVEPLLSRHFKNEKSKMTKKEILSIREQYLDSLLSFNFSEKIVTDKMPVNFRLIGFILSAIPEAKIIHLKRDARAVCWSNYKHYFSAGNGFSFSQEDLVKFYELYSEMMEYWHKLFPNKIYDINYEELTKNQKKETQKLLKYCDLDWDENCLKFHKNTRGVVTASSSQIRQKMYQGSSEAWKKYESNLIPLIEGLKSY